MLNKVAMLREMEQLDVVMDKLDQIVADPFNKLNSSDDILSFVKVDIRRSIFFAVDTILEQSLAKLHNGTVI